MPIIMGELLEGSQFARRSRTFNITDYLLETEELKYTTYNIFILIGRIDFANNDKHWFITLIISFYIAVFI